MGTLSRNNIKLLDEIFDKIISEDLPIIASEKVIKDILKLQKATKRALKPIKVSSAKGKGRGLQQTIAKRIAEKIEIPYGNTDDHLIRSREMGQNGVDVILLREAREKFPYSIEAKNTETFNLGNVMLQAQANMYPGTDWMIVWKKNGIKPVVCLDFEHFISRYKEPMEGNDGL